MKLQLIKIGKFGIYVAITLATVSFAFGQWVATARVKEGLDTQIAVIGTNLNHQTTALQEFRQEVRLEIKDMRRDINTQGERLIRLEERFNAQFPQTTSSLSLKTQE